jgi:hypothetical protein
VGWEACCALWAGQQGLERHALAHICTRIHQSPFRLLEHSTHARRQLRSGHNHCSACARSFPALRAIVACFMEGGELLITVVAMLVFVMFMFAVAGTEMFAGAPRWACLRIMAWEGQGMGGVKAGETLSRLHLVPGAWRWLRHAWCAVAVNVEDYVSHHSFVLLPLCDTPLRLCHHTIPCGAHRGVPLALRGRCRRA